LIGAKKYFEKYTTIEFSFATTKEYLFLQEIADSIEKGDFEGFSDSVTKWDKTNVVDEWKTKILLNIKKSIEEEPSLI
jgi:alpha-soluble NSF attachment protein